MNKKFVIGGLLVLFSFQLASALPPGFSLTTVATGLNRAITIRFSPDGRLFYLEQLTGQVRTMNNLPGTYVLNSTPWATLAIDSAPDTERGLLGLCFDPDFTTNHYVYLYHSVQSSSNNRIIRLTEDTTTQTANLLSMVTVLEIVDSDLGTNHNSGNMTFGPDTMLYISVGDGGLNVGLRPQDTTNPFGKILRLNPYSSLPLTFNPSMIYAYGLRNSFDMAWNPVNHVLYATENGPTSNDEINRIVLGGNYGWTLATGYSNNTTFINPLFDFGTTSTVAPTGICFYPDHGTFPSEYCNKMFAVDFLKGNIWCFKFEDENCDEIETYEILTSTPAYTYADIEPGPDGCLYFAGFSRIMKLSYTTGVDDSWKLLDKTEWKSQSSPLYFLDADHSSVK